ncbi:hypothetical protein [Corynebacterium sp. A21]|uniref:hypothetical protein n=1 Tax=Corynebacterium sp. A21 TaxID=3457318 RepID=UPI003FCF2E53
MAKHISVADLLDNPIADAVQEAGVAAIHDQGWFARRKNSLTAAAQVVLQILNLLIFTMGDVHWGITLGVAIVIGVAEVIVHASSRGPVTPSGIAAIQLKAAQISRTPAPVVGSSLPVFTGPTSAGR